MVCFVRRANPRIEVSNWTAGFDKVHFPLPVPECVCAA